MCNYTSRHAWKTYYFNIKIRRQFLMASMEPCKVRRMVAHWSTREQQFGQHFSMINDGQQFSNVTDLNPQKSYASCDPKAVVKLLPLLATISAIFLDLHFFSK